jgi:sulfonate transport system substrate-binding protein
MCRLKPFVKLPVGVLAAVFACSTVMAADAGHAVADPTVIRIAVVAAQVGGNKPSFFGPPEYMANDPVLKAELDKRHVSIEWMPVSAVAVATLVNEAFTSQRIDFAYYGDLPSVILNASGFQTRLIAPGNIGNNVYLMVPPGSTAQSIADLKGKRIALNRGRPWEVSFEKLLTANGLKFSDFKVVNLNPQAGASALVSGSVDAFVTLDDAFLLVDKGLGKIIWSTKQAPPDWKMRAELWGTADFVQQHPDLTQVLANADLRAVHWISEDQNRASYLHDLAERYSYPESVIDREFANEAVSWHNYWSPLYSATITTHYEGVVAYARSAGLIRNDVPVGPLIVPQFVDAGLKQLGFDGYWKAPAAL